MGVVIWMYGWFTHGLALLDKLWSPSMKDVLNLLCMTWVFLIIYATSQQLFWQIFFSGSDSVMSSCWLISVLDWFIRYIWLETLYKRSWLGLSNRSSFERFRDFQYSVIFNVNIIKLNLGKRYTSMLFLESNLIFEHSTVLLPFQSFDLPQTWHWNCVSSESAFVSCSWYRLVYNQNVSTESCIESRFWLGWLRVAHRKNA